MPVGLAFTVSMIFSVDPLDVGRLHDVERALRVRDDLAVRVLLPERVDLRDGEARVDRAVPLPQHQLRVPRLLRRKTAADLVRIPHDHAIERHAQLVGGVAPEVLVGQHQQLLAALPRPRHHRRRVGRRADDAAVLADEAP